MAAGLAVGRRLPAYRVAKGELLGSGKTVILIMPLLSIGFDVPHRWMENQARAGRAIDEWKVEADPILIMAGLRAEITKTLDRYKRSRRLIAADLITAESAKAIIVTS